MNVSKPSPHPWKFFRHGGLDQVTLENGADLLALDQLDQKLWVALSCPVKGLVLDEKTLALIDTDADGRIGVPEVIAAVRWALVRLRDSDTLLKGAESLPLGAINDQTAEGKVLVAAARQLLESHGRAEAVEISVAEAADTTKLLGVGHITGEGVITPEAVADPAAQTVIREIISCTGGSPRRGGGVGVTAAAIDAFFADLAAYVAWAEQGQMKVVVGLNGTTDPAWKAVKAVRAKVEDYFARTRLAGFDRRALAALNRSETEYVALATAEMKLSADEARGFPLAHVEPGKPLPLIEGVNPAWAEPMRVLYEQVVVPIFGAEKTALTPADWAAVNTRFAPYEAWMSSKPAPAVEKIGLTRAKDILSSSVRAVLQETVTRDRALEPEYKALGDLERLVRYHRDLRALLHNFVNFADFYSPTRYAIFQAGTLYLDNRATELCIRVDGVSPLAAMSKAYIAYCSCTRAGGGEKMTIAACFTQGDSDYLFVGRNGVFYDRQGRLWYAVITSIVDNPISIRQAFWSPYKKFLRFIEEQVAKRAAAADAAASGKLAGAAEQAANVDKAKVEPKKFDLALITGIGVAIGSIGTFLAAIFTKFLDVPWWQLPLIVVGAMLVISLPSMIIAALKLRQRTLGPLLEGNGWAINGRVKINIPFGTKLTEMAAIPPGSKRLLDDPYADHETAAQRRRVMMLLVLLVLVAGSFWIRWDHNQRGRYFWQPAKPAAAAPAK